MRGFLLTTLLLPDWGPNLLSLWRANPSSDRRPCRSPNRPRLSAPRRRPMTGRWAPFYLPPGSPALAARWKSLLGQERRVW